MQYRRLGNTELSVSEIGVGCWAIGGVDWNLDIEMGWGGTNDEDALEGLFRAYELGANHYDTADVYGHGHSERLIGSFLKGVSRESVVIGSKVGYFKGTASSAYDPIHMRHQLEMSLHNLGIDYLDIYYFHNYNFGQHDEYLEDAIDTMRRFQDEGLIRFIGQRGPHTYAPDRLQKNIKPIDEYQRFQYIAQLVQPDVIQIRYNMISPTYDSLERDIFGWAEVRQVGIVINKPLAQGLLLNKYSHDNPPQFQAGDHRNRKKWFQSSGLQVLRRQLLILEDRFGQRPEDLVRISLQYCLNRSRQAVVVTGFRNAQQIEMNLLASGNSLSFRDIEYIRNVMTGINEEIGTFF